MLDLSFKKRNSSNSIYKLIYVYYFTLSIFMVTPYYYIINPLSILVSSICFINIIINPIKGGSSYILFYLFQFVFLVFNLLFLKNQENSFWGLGSLFKDVITALIPALFIIDLPKLKKALLAIILGGSINIFINIINGFESLFSGVRYISEEMMLSLNSFALASLIYFLCTILLFYLVRNKTHKFLLLILAFLIVLSLFITGARQSFVSLGFFLLVVFLYELKRFKLQSVILVISGVVLFLIGAYISIKYLPESPIVRRFLEDNSGDVSRIYLFQQAWDLFLLQPFVGYGVGAFKYFSRYVYTHSTYSEILFTGGFFYALFYLLYYSKFVIVINKLINRISDIRIQRLYIIVFAVIVSLLINGFFILVHADRIALTVQFFLINFVFSTKGFFTKQSSIL